MSRPQPKLFTVKSDAEWEAINSPVRVEMLVYMIMTGACSIREIAESLDRPADGLYHHMRKLVRAGIVAEVGTRKAGTQTEVVYQTVARDVTVDRNIRRKKTQQRMLRLFRTMLQHAQRTVEAAVRSGAAVLEGEHQNFRFKLQTSWLDDRQLKAVMEHQAAIHEILQVGMRRRAGQLVAVLTYLSPVVRTRGAQSHQSQENPP